MGSDVKVILRKLSGDELLRELREVQARCLSYQERKRRGRYGKRNGKSTKNNN